MNVTFSDAAGFFLDKSRQFIEESEEQIGEREPWWYSAKLSEEAGEAAGAFNRSTGLSRRPAKEGELEREICDAIFAAFILAAKLKLTLPFEDGFSNVMTRGFRDV
jgi:NTP pyrophosphatase (non-canonical NTP hydrolase)